MIKGSEIAGNKEKGRKGTETGRWERKRKKGK
jgi:hypothetical protein